MMKRLVLFVLMVVAGQVVEGAILNDDFDDGTLSPLWSARWGGPSSVVESGGQLNIDVATSSSYADGVARSNFVLEGDFDVSIDFTDFGPGAAAPFRHSYLHFVGTDSAQMRGIVRINDLAGAGRSYNMYLPSYGIDYEVATTDTSGSLRIVREGSIFTGYYHDGSAWVSLGSGSAWTEATSVNLGAGSDSPYPGVSVSFDNFQATANQITSVPEPSAFVMLGALGGLGLIAARRRRKRVA